MCVGGYVYTHKYAHFVSACMPHAVRVYVWVRVGTLPACVWLLGWCVHVCLDKLAVLFRILKKYTLLTIYGTACINRLPEGWPSVTLPCQV